MNFNNDTISTYPLPPIQYIEKYTDENLKKEADSQFDLRPPPIPHDFYSCFGVFHEIDEIPLKSLESQGIRRLYPQKFNRKQELEKILKSILTNFFDLLDILINDPDSLDRVEKLDDINLLFIHMSHLINEYRPLQAKFVLKALMKRQLNERKQVTQNLKENLAKTKEVLEALKTLLPDKSDLSQNKTDNTISMEIEPIVQSFSNVKENLPPEKPSNLNNLLEKDNILFSTFNEN